MVSGTEVIWTYESEVEFWVSYASSKETENYFTPLFFSGTFSIFF